MPVNDRHTVGMHRKADIRQIELPVVNCPEHLAWLPGDFLLLSADEGDDVAENVERGRAWVTRAGNGLHGHRKNTLDTKGFLQDFQCYGHARAGAVGVGDDETCAVVGGFLSSDKRRVLRVDFWKQDRREWIFAECTRVGANCCTRLCEKRLDGFGFFFWQR